MKQFIFLIFTSFFLHLNAKNNISLNEINKIITIASDKYISMDKSLEFGKFPKTLRKNNLVTSDIYWWCSGFYPGTLWYLYEYTGKKELIKLAQKYTEQLQPLQYLKTDHDIGFQLFCSYGNGYRITHNTKYLDVLHNGAYSLSTRFNPIIGCIRSWDHHTEKWKFPVIIDNMMNLELLMWVGNFYNDNYLKYIGITHANTTLRNHFRDDYSTFHLIDYNPENGDIIKKQTVQGYDDNSKWSRGQAWGLYGFTMMYRMTNSSLYLKQAEAIADLLIPLLPSDGIPYWDYDSPEIPNDFRDASAAAIMASALIELSDYIPNKKNLYLKTAILQIKTLSSQEYFAKDESNGNFILKHSVGHKPMSGEVDVPLTYADYYFIEALIRLSKKLE